MGKELPSRLVLYRPLLLEEEGFQGILINESSIFPFEGPELSNSIFLEGPAISMELTFFEKQ
jgi:hypothetical protein